MQFEHANITLGEDGVYVDGHRIPALTIAPNVVVHHGGRNTIGPKVTLTLYANEVTITDEAKANEGCTITEVRGDQQVCTQTYTRRGCACSHSIHTFTEPVPDYTMIALTRDE
ncbi:hypothetical protein MUN76_15305 [Leucobacter rhizosphaerae]|uniref:Uncharacterized protein n=1 Tax=Leucobacter rhizosphaerae TaxID=2932245 RepID=A0ABY4FVX0_9MICO|nr:hypothetical protein [Leucobacter rhizosphaerae]UOQ60376.1 hypothetical protein MUN76_15305 [Leucobacter rhizosphaerae]